MAVIKQLSPVTINRIAAGEVIERPASVVKELVENSLDAGATDIKIIIEAGGKNLIVITDNGCGISKEDLPVAVDRHTTSKLKDDDLINIYNFGFRGEALPAIGSVSRLTIKSRLRNENDGWQISVFGGEKSGIMPTPHIGGTNIEVKDLFFATPARLKFLKSERTEIQNIVDIVKRIAIAHHNVALSITSDEKIILDLRVKTDDLLAPKFSRISDILSKDFIENAIPLKFENEEIKISGYASLPTYNRGTSEETYLYVNNRPVRDKLLFTAIRIAYHDFISRDRYPVVVLFLEVPCELVDVNVHPNKAEVRFRDNILVRNSIISAIKSAILDNGQQTSSTIAQQTINLLQPKYTSTPVNFNTSSPKNWQSPSFNKPVSLSQEFTPVSLSKEITQPTARSLQEDEAQDIHQNDYPLGAAKCQLHKTYIVSQTENSIIITDQHAAHERLTYERLKIQLENGEIESQRLLIPEIVESDENTITILLNLQSELQKLGLIIDPYTTTSISVRATPITLGNCNTKKLMQDIIDDLKEYGENVFLKELVSHVLATYACHHSIRAGREMNNTEMNNLLREMEQTPHSGQCNHGRPTYIELKLKDIEKLFGRS
jgi:DNA mismatch repair protein MutL